MSPSPTPYRDPHGKPRIRRSIAGFCDLLGFSHACTAQADPAESKQLLQRIVDAIEESRRFVKDEFAHEHKADPSRWTLKFFSDNLVFGYPSDEGNDLRLWASQFVVRCVQRYQLRMALNGFFVRGALTEGLICLSDEIIFGPALVESYRLESNAAVVPRVVLTQPLYELYGEGSDTERTRILPDVSEWVCRDIDGWWFVNYLHAAVIGGTLDWGLVERHKAAVLSSLTSTTRHEVLPKFGWSRRYHNVFCHWHSGDPGYSPRYRIDYADETSTIIRMGDVSPPAH